MYDPFKPKESLFIPFAALLSGRTNRFLRTSTSVSYTHLLFNGISLPVQQIQLGISHLCIIRYEQEEILKITNTVHRIDLLRIINADQDIAVKATFVIIELADFRIYIYRIPTIGVIITFCPFKRVVQTEVYQIFIPVSYTQLDVYKRQQ